MKHILNGLSDEEKNYIIVNNNKIYLYDLLISESDIDTLTNVNDKIDKVNSLANKIIAKYSELEIVYGKMFQLRSSKKEEFKVILNTDGINHYEEMEKIYKSLDL